MVLILTKDSTMTWRPIKTATPSKWHWDFAVVAIGFFQVVSEICGLPRWNCFTVIGLLQTFSGDHACCVSKFVLAWFYILRNLVIDPAYLVRPQPNRLCVFNGFHAIYMSIDNYIKNSCWWNWARSWDVSCQQLINDDPFTIILTYICIT